MARAATNAKQARRLLSLSLIYNGHSRQEAARHAGISLQTVRDWALRFNERGSDGLIDGRSPGTPPRLDAEHRAALVRVVEEGPTPYLHGVVRGRLAEEAFQTSWKPGAGRMRDQRYDMLAGMWRKCGRQ